MKIGDTLVWCPPGTVKDHLWILISDPAAHGGKCVVVNLTESAHGKFSFVLKPGQHPWIYKDSDVNFGDAFITSETHLQRQIQLQFAVPHLPMDPKIATQIIKAAGALPAFPRMLRKLLPAV